jgi:hypothetical protein
MIGVPMITGRKIAKGISGNGETPPRNTPLIAERCRRTAQLDPFRTSVTRA